MADVTALGFEDLEPISDGLARRARAAVGVTAFGPAATAERREAIGLRVHRRRAAADAVAARRASSGSAARRPGLIRRFQEAWDAVDLDGLVAPLADDALLTMPPEGVVIRAPRRSGVLRDGARGRPHRPHRAAAGDRERPARSRRLRRGRGDRRAHRRDHRPPRGDRGLYERLGLPVVLPDGDA